MRILFINNHCITDPTVGVTRSLWTLLRWLAEAGHEVRALTTARFESPTLFSIEEHLASLTMSAPPGSAILSYSLDNDTYTPFGTYNTTVADRSGDVPRWVDIPLGVTARYVRVQLFDGSKETGTSPGGKPWIFLDEARVDGVVPEPAAFALMLTGAATMGLVTERTPVFPV